MTVESTLGRMSRLAAPLIAALLALVPLAGCGADDINPNALAEAAEATRKQGGVHMTMTGTVESQGQKVPLEMEGDADLKSLRMHAKVKPGGGVPEMEQVMIGTVMYMKMEGLEQALGAEWVKVDLAAVGEDLGVDFEQLMQLSSGSPAQQLDYLRAIADLEKVGEEDVDGVGTTHYKGVFDMRKYPDAVPEAEREQARKSIEKLIELSGDATMPMEVWVDDDSLVRRQKFAMSQKKPVDMKMDMDIRYSDFGKQVDIEAPKGAKDVTELAKQGASGG